MLRLTYKQGSVAKCEVLSSLSVLSAVTQVIEWFHYLQSYMS